MSFVSEFKEFAVKGNAMDLAVGVMIGAAFQRIVNSLVNDILMPPIGLLIGDTKFNNLFINLSSTPVSTVEEAKTAGIPTINYGMFINEIISFLILGFILFLMVKMMNTLRREES